MNRRRGPARAVAVLVGLSLAGSEVQASDDSTAPTTTIVSQQAPGTAVAGDTLFGNAADDLSGVASVTVTFTPAAPTPGAVPVTEPAVLGCTTQTTCVWSVPEPAARGVYSVTAVASDRAGNVESPGASLTLVDVGPGTVPVGPGVLPDPSDTPIQPGAPIHLHRGPLAGTPWGVCTMNFVFAEAAPGGARGRRQLPTFIGTAGHCVIMVGERAAAPGIGEFGTVVYMKECRFTPCGSGDSAFDDFALIRIDGDKLHLVSAHVRGHGRLAGYTTPADTAAGDLIFMHGWGQLFDAAPATRDRYAVLIEPTDDHFASTMPATSDSGSPAVHVASGQALGVIAVREEAAGNVTGGPTVERILVLLDEAGFEVELVTELSL